MLLLLLSFVVPLLIGFLSVSFFWPAQRGEPACFYIKCSLAVGLGFGACSSLFFIWLSFFGRVGIGFFVTEAALLLMLTAAQLSKFGGCKSPMFSDTPICPKPISSVYQILVIGFFIAGILAITTFAFLSLKHPHGHYDGWEIWNMHARFMFRGGVHWADYFSKALGYSHPDYPLLISAAIARSWTYTGTDTVIVPVLVAMFFTSATLLLLVSALSVLATKTQGFLGGLILLGTPFFITHGASQYADVPLGFFFLATIVLFILQERSSTSNYSFLTLAGIMAGFAAWTKNEGLLFLITVLIAHIAVSVPLSGWRGYRGQLLSFLFGMVPVILIVAYFKIRYAPVNDFVAGQGFYVTLTRMTDISRYTETVAAFVKGIFYFGNWPLALSLPTVLVFYTLLLGFHDEKKKRTSTFLAPFVIALMLIGYFFTYITTHAPLTWHLDTSLDRLFLQLWPSSILAYFLPLSSPEGAMGTMTNAYSKRVASATTLLLLLTLVSNVRLLKSAVTFGSTSIGSDDISMYEKRFDNLRKVLPSYGTIGYLCDFDPKILEIGAVVANEKIKEEYRWTQYVLSPLILRPVTANALQGLQFALHTSPEFVKNKKISTNDGLRLEDFGNGVRLYRTGMK